MKTNYEGEKSKLAWVLGIIGGFVPLIVRLKAMKIPEGGEIWDNGTGIYGDFFSANKLLALGVLIIIALIIFAIEYKKGLYSREDQEENFIYSNKFILILLACYLGIAAISTLLVESNLRGVALWGAPGRYEGLIAIILYGIIMVLGISIGKDWWNIRLVYKILALGSFILALIGVAQFLGWDFIQSDGGKALMLPFKFQHLAGDIDFTFAGKVYTTLYNPNYVGSYTAMLMPISLTALIYTYLYSKDKEKWFNATLATLMMIALWITSYSRGGLLGGAFALIIMATTLHKHLIKSKKQLGMVVVLACIGFIGLNVASKGVIFRRIQTLPREAIKLVSKNQSQTPQLRDVRLEDRAVEVDSNLPTFRIELKEDGLIMQDEKGEEVSLTLGENNNYTPEDEAYLGLEIELKSEDQFVINIENPGQNANYSMYLAHTPAGLRILGNHNTLYDVLPVPSWGFEGKERLGSARGYIWSRTIPMIGDKWLLGHGLDTYAVKFPQHDIIGKANAYGTTNMIVDKPHNLYLQTMVSTGIPSMIILLVIFVIYCIRWVKHLKTLDKDDIRRWMSIGIFAAVCGYLVAGLFNDSVVSVAPVFWILWGLGIGLTSSDGSVKVS